MRQSHWLVLILLGGIQTIAAQEATRPHVLFIAVDDLNDWISPLGGHPQTLTPNLNDWQK